MVLGPTSRPGQAVPCTGVVECQAGVILHNLGEAVAEHGYTLPLDLGSRGSCFIGGNSLWTLILITDSDLRTSTILF